MSKDSIEKTLVVLDEEEVRELLQVAQRDSPQEIWDYMLKIFIKKVEAVLRRRCG